MSLVTLPQNISNYDPSSGRSVKNGLPQPVSISRNATGQLEITPTEGGGLGYGIGNALSRGFLKISDAFQSIVSSIPDFSLFQGVSAAEIPEVNNAEQKKNG